MIVQEHLVIDGRNFIRTASDSGRYVVRDGVSYAEAYDLADSGRQYTEGDMILIEGSEAEKLLNILTGGMT